MSNTPAEQIVWIDCEMTGLEIETDRLCELAIIVTDFDLTPLHEGFTVVINPGEEALAGMNDFVRNMHTTSGLLEEMQQGLTAEVAEQQALDYVNGLVSEGSRPLVAGNTIGMDRRFIAKYLPVFDERMHYRSVDVSTIKELSRRWYPSTFYRAPEKHGGHRALADIAESIRELAFFRDTVMVKAPGPGSDEVKEQAKKTIADYAPLIDGMTR
ncbi:oligoribonuclease [Leucobacter sp. UCMA 4100]|uniref:oligoribonuclease n=1 Tax=Leucobacter sp. UCMA 4100 TaxID=2810534 RepID=UPI0022EB2267|nr:oligoribonuclease [Leucobacter sp. UCMA 4100]MDA3145972.1 oligoribonuclease [Leucobacter sp. UCMA 4100]